MARRNTSLLRNGVITLTVLAAATAASAAMVMQRDAARTLPGDPAALRAEIAQATQTIKRLSRAPRMPALWQSWRQAEALAGLWRSTLTPLPTSTRAPYRGLAAAWHGVIRGKARDVAACALQLQGIVPARFGAILVKNGDAVVTVSVLGVKT